MIIPVWVRQTLQQQRYGHRSWSNAARPAVGLMKSSVSALIQSWRWAGWLHTDTVVLTRVDIGQPEHTASLYWICSGTRGQGKSLNSGVAWWYLLALAMRYAAALTMVCSCSLSVPSQILTHRCNCAVTSYGVGQKNGPILTVNNL